MQFVKATKQTAKLRLAESGPSGSGKSFTALRIAAGIIAGLGSGRIAVICTERGRARKYSDRFNFDVLDLTDYTIDGYKAAIAAAADAGYEVLIIDSISHEWQQLCVENDRLADRKYRGNSWAAWSESTPRHQEFIGAIMSYPGHVICTMRSKTDWFAGPDGANKPRKIGLAPEQGKHIEYEFDILMELSMDHVATVTKDITCIYQDQYITKPDQEVGKKLIAWLNAGTPATAAAPISNSSADLDFADDEKFQDKLASAFKTRGFNDDQAMASVGANLDRLGKGELLDLSVSNRKAFVVSVQTGGQDAYKRNGHPAGV